MTLTPTRALLVLASILTSLIFCDGIQGADDSASELSRIKQKFTAALSDNASASHQDDGTFVLTIESHADDVLNKIGLLDEKTCSTVSAIYIEDTPQTEESWKNLAQLSKLRVIGCDIRGPWPKEATMSVSDLEQLEQLSIQCGSISDGDIEDIAKLSAELKSLEIRDMDIKKNNLGSIAKLKHLRHLGLANTRVTADQLSWLPKLGKLESLDLSGTTIKDDVIQYLAKCGRLEKVRIVNSSISEAGAKKVFRILAGERDIP